MVQKKKNTHTKRIAWHGRCCLGVSFLLFLSLSFVASLLFSFSFSHLLLVIDIHRAYLASSPLRVVSMAQGVALTRMAG